MASNMPPPLHALARMIAERASAMTGVHRDEILTEIGPGRRLDARGAGGRNWTFDGHVVAQEVRTAVAQAIREITTEHPVVDDGLP